MPNNVTVELSAVSQYKRGCADGLPQLHRQGGKLLIMSSLNENLTS